MCTACTTATESMALTLEVVDADGKTVSTTEYATAADLWAALYPDLKKEARS